MNIITCVKVVPEDVDIQVNADRTLDYSKAHAVVSTYDLNAIEAAAQLAEAEGAKLSIVTVGAEFINDSKNNKNILARGADELFMAADSAFDSMDAHATAETLAKAIEAAGSADLIICGDGSADLYAQQTEVQLACVLGLPFVTAVSKFALENGMLVCERTLENEVETVELALPAVVSVLPDIARPRIAGMRDIMKAGKKPVHQLGSMGMTAPESAVELLDTLAPEPAARKGIIFDAAEDGAIDEFVSAITEHIR